MPKLRAVCAPTPSDCLQLCETHSSWRVTFRRTVAVRNLQTFPRERRDGETHILFRSLCTYGFSLTGDRANARPEMFRIGDGWFTYNVVGQLLEPRAWRDASEVLGI